LQCVAVCCSVLQCVAACCSVLQCVAVCCSVCWTRRMWIVACECAVYICSYTYIFLCYKYIYDESIATCIIATKNECICMYIYIYIYLWCICYLECESLHVNVRCIYVPILLLHIWRVYYYWPSYRHFYDVPVTTDISMVLAPNLNRCMWICVVYMHINLNIFVI